MQKESNAVVVLTAVQRNGLNLLTALGRKLLSEHLLVQANLVLDHVLLKAPQQLVVRQLINPLARFGNNQQLRLHFNLELLNSGLH